LLQRSPLSRKHAGQVDKDGTDYHLHPIAVMRRLPADVDFLEDTKFTRQDLEGRCYSKRTLDAVELLTIKPDDRRSYANKIDALIACGNRDAIEGKYADMSENSDTQ
jgi:hypothetical protein